MSRPHSPRMDPARGVLILYVCRKCGRTAVLDPTTGKAHHVAGLPGHTIRAEHITERVPRGVDNFPGQ